MERQIVWLYRRLGRRNGWCSALMERATNTTVRVPSLFLSSLVTRCIEPSLSANLLAFYAKGGTW